MFWGLTGGTEIDRRKNYSLFVIVNNKIENIEKNTLGKTGCFEVCVIKISVSGKLETNYYGGYVQK